MPLEEFKKCIQAEPLFSNISSSNSEFTSEDKLIEQHFKVMDLNDKKLLNFYDYVQLRKYMKAYTLLIDIDEEVYYRNFPIGMHLIKKGRYRFFITRGTSTHRLTSCGYITGLTSTSSSLKTTKWISQASSTWPTFINFSLLTTMLTTDSSD